MHSSVTSSGYSECCHCVYFSSTNEHCKHAAGHEEEWKQQRDAENVSRYQCEEQVYDVVRYIYINIYTYTYICKMRTHTSENVQRTCCLLCRECVFATALLHCWMMTLWCIEECRSLNANPSLGVLCVLHWFWFVTQCQFEHSLIETYRSSSPTQFQLEMI